MSATPGPSSDAPVGPPPPIASKPPVAVATAPAVPPQQPAQKPQAAPQKAANNRVAVPLLGQPRSAATALPPPNDPAAGQVQSFQDATQAATAAVAAAMAKLGPGRGQQQTDGATDNLMQKVQQMRVQDQQQRGGARGTRSRGTAPRGGTARGKPIDVPKEDFDFESSNAKFNKQEMAKEAVNIDSPAGEPSDPIAASPPTNGHTEDDEYVVIPPAEKKYDKKSSFFDNISSDLKDRQEQVRGEVGFDGRAMRAQERGKNMETFGQSNIEGGGYRGGYRGRGRGFNGGYRGRGGFRGRGAPNPTGFAARTVGARGGAEGPTVDSAFAS